MGRPHVDLFWSGLKSSFNQCSHNLMIYMFYNSVKNLGEQIPLLESMILITYTVKAREVQNKYRSLERSRCSRVWGPRHWIIYLPQRSQWFWDPPVAKCCECVRWSIRMETFCESSRTAWDRTRSLLLLRKRSKLCFVWMCMVPCDGLEHHRFLLPSLTQC